jgi:hypothetical protein
MLGTQEIGPLIRLLNYAVAGIKGITAYFRGRLRRPIKQRKDADRRAHADRRVAPVRQRLRRGFWLQYHRVTGSGKFDELLLDQHRRYQISDALHPEALNYLFRDRENGAEVAAATAVKLAVDFVALHPSDRLGPGPVPQAVYVVEEIAEWLVQSYNVSQRDRRESERRAAASA